MDKQVQAEETLVDQMARVLQARVFHSDPSRRIPNDLTLVGIDLGQPGSLAGLADDDLWERVLLPCAQNLSGAAARERVSLLGATWSVHERSGFVSIDVVTEQDPFVIAAAYQRMANHQVANTVESLRHLLTGLAERILPALPEDVAFMLRPTVESAAAGKDFVPLRDDPQAD